ncbi:UV DNA damage repair endonuclease UvsE [bacterium]|nr:UV DNA damage repair endonuclease UvsE [bacterium]
MTNESAVESAPSTKPRFRLGFPVKVIGAPNLPSHDSRRWHNNPHLSVSLAYLRDIFVYLGQRGIKFYRMAGQLAPYLTHPALPAFHRQLQECDLELAALGDLARQDGLRLTLHPGFFVQLNSPDESWVQRSVTELAASAELLARMGLSDESVIVVHVGGVHGDVLAGRERFVRQVNLLPEAVKNRLVLEHDDRRYHLQDALWIYQRTGLRIVFDVLHHRCFDPVDMPLVDALRLALSTWPQTQRPKIHMSSPRTEVRTLVRHGGLILQPPLPNQHSDFINPFEVIDLLSHAMRLGLRPFDVMLEAKAKDVALLRLREQIKRFAPKLGAVVG